MKILIADDVPANCRLLQGILAPYGTADAVHDGRDAVNAFQDAWKSGEPYRLICLDIQMPSIDGMKALNVIRQMEKAMKIGEADRARILIVTSKDGFRSSAGRLGSDGYLEKPIDRNRLLEKLGDFGFSQHEA